MRCHLATSALVCRDSMRCGPSREVGSKILLLLIFVMEEEPAEIVCASPRAASKTYLVLELENSRMAPGERLNRAEILI